MLLGINIKHKNIYIISLFLVLVGRMVDSSFSSSDHRSSARFLPPPRHYQLFRWRPKLLRNFSNTCGGTSVLGGGMPMDVMYLGLLRAKCQSKKNLQGRSSLS